MRYSVRPNSPCSSREAWQYAACASSAVLKYPSQWFLPLAFMTERQGFSHDLCVLYAPLRPDAVSLWRRTLSMFCECVARRRLSNLLSRGLPLRCSTSKPSGVGPLWYSHTARERYTFVRPRKVWAALQLRTARYPSCCQQALQFQRSTAGIDSTSINVRWPLLRSTTAIPLKGSTYIGRMFLVGCLALLLSYTPVGIPRTTPRTG